MNLDSHIDRVERYGFMRRKFPRRYNGHRITLLKNDAHDTFEERLLFHFTLYCDDCKTEYSVRGRFPADTDDAERRVQLAKMAVFGPFVRNSCST